MNISEKEKQLRILNSKLQKCQRCQLAKTRNRALPGAGCLEPRIMIIAQAPGDQEDLEGRLFVGPAGKEFDQLLSHAGISRPDIFITNLLKCRLPKCRKPKQREIDACLPYLEQEIEIINPEILVPLGFYSTRSVLSLNNISPMQSKADCNAFFGKLFWSNHKKVYPLPHPAVLLYNNSYREKTQALYDKLQVFSHICRWYRSCPIRRFYEKGLLAPKWVELYCKGDWSECVRFKKEEQGIYHPDWMLPDGSLDYSLKNLEYA